MLGHGLLVRCLLLVVSLCLVPIYSHAIPEFLAATGTQVVLDISVDAKGVSQVVSGANVDMAYKGVSAIVVFDLAAQQIEKPYALRVDAPEPPFLTVNGKELVVVPVRGVDGWYYRVGVYYLAVGRNEIAMAPADDSSLDLAAVQMASLEHTAEDADFDRFFSVQKPSLAVQPAIDPEQAKYDAAHYDLTITLNMGSRFVSGALMMTATSTNSTLTTAVLDLDDNGGSIVVSQVDQGPSTATLPFTHNASSNRVFITLPAAVPAGSTFTVRVFYSGTPLTTGTFGPGYNRTTHSGTSLIYTFSEPYKARTWWPCKDVPGDKATMDLHVTCPTGYFVVSNGTLVSTVDNGNGTLTFNWSEAYPMATYLASICCTNYQKASGTYTALDGVTTMEVAHYVYPESYAFDSQGLPGTLQAMGYFANTFGEYPFLTEKYVTATHGSGSGMEHQTCTSMPNNDVGISGGTGRRNIHELSHMWFGDMITMAHFDHLWLNEGYATYCEALFYEWRDGRQAYHNYVNAWTTA
ncbi:MAG TPA: M1 family metallopeptidase, partial [bacterium]|nr:M1 family metallopeptidase [bacterium]